MGKIIMAQPSPTLAPCAADKIAAAVEASSGAESSVIVNGSHLRKASVPVMGATSRRSTRLPQVRASHGPEDSNEGRRSDRRQRVA
jgi:hypothetical protein